MNCFSNQTNEYHLMGHVTMNNHQTAIIDHALLQLLNVQNVVMFDVSDLNFLIHEQN